MTYSMFEWISGARNKAANCLSRIVQLPSDSKATVKMLTATNSDEPAFNTRNKKSHQHQATTNTEPPNTQPNRDTVTPDLCTMNGTLDITPKTPNE